MKTFSIHQVRAVLAVGVVGALLAVAYFANPGFLKTPNTQAGTSQNISGWMWSETVGWMSFNSLGCDSDKNGFIDTGICGGDNTTTATQDYGVNVDTLTKGTGGNGVITGNAWGEHIGWVSFDRTRTGNPPSGPFNGGSGPIAQVDWLTGKVTGWMRALSACQNNLVNASGNCTGSGAGDAAGGWDGWIKLSDEANTDDWAGNGVKIIANKFSGYAWGGGDAPGIAGVTGWVDFAPKIGGISVGPTIGVPPCVAGDVPASSWGACQALPSSTCSGSGTQTFIGGGIRVGACTSGGTTTGPCDVTVACTAPPTSGPAPVAGCNYNKVCNTGESPLTCPADCKVKYKQF